ncbi:NAD-dependent epimerase/dehydratase family protein [Haliangium sp.]|uniref:NAD-dependent epimerase/dehydratase family protein n=1 Tax=Haliangium sp. TaxID=2663208 RepID=UPI003D122E05
MTDKPITKPEHARPSGPGAGSQKRAKRAFVTGSTGLLGNNLVRILAAEGWSVRALARDPEKASRQLGGVDGVEVISGDLADVAGFASALAGVDVVFNTAAYFREYDGDDDDKAVLHELNVEAPVLLANAAMAQGVSRFVHTSSAGVIQPKADGSLGTEEDIRSPEGLFNHYYASKVMADRALAELRRDSGLDLVTVLPGWMFGPGDAAPTGAGELIRDALAGKLPPVALPGNTSFVDARDVAQVMVRAAALAESGERFIAAGHGVTVAEVITLVAREVGCKPPRFTLPYWLALAYAWVAETVARWRGIAPLITPMRVRTLKDGLRLSSARAESRLGVRFRPIEHTLRDTVAWFRDRVDAPIAEVSPVAA